MLKQLSKMNTAFFVKIFMISLIAIFLYSINCNTSTISSSGGIIAASFWIYFIISTRDECFDFELLSASTWLIFSITVLIVSVLQ